MLAFKVFFVVFIDMCPPIDFHVSYVSYTNVHTELDRERETEREMNFCFSVFFKYELALVCLSLQ
jgi:hypothetical protein